jgi:hypothetical protein
MGSAFTETREIAMSKMPVGVCLRGAIILLCLAGLAPISARGDDTVQIQQVLKARCVNQGKLGKTPGELDGNCGCLAQVGARHLRPEWRTAILNGGSQQGLGAPMDDQAKFEADALQTCPAIGPYAPKPAGQ